MRPFRLLLAASAVALLVVGTATAQRGRGPSEEIGKRSGSFVVDVKLPPPDQDDHGKIPLAACSLVQSAAKAGHLSFLYLFDPDKKAAKHEQFEQTIFGHDEISVTLRLFQCGRVNLAQDADAKAEFGADSPLFVAFDAKGECVGTVSMGNYKATATPILDLLERAHRGHAKLKLPGFVTQYRKFLRDYAVYEGRKKVLDDSRRRLQQKDKPPANKLADLDKEEAALTKERDELLALEQRLLEQAKVPPRDPKAVRIGERRRR